MIKVLIIGVGLLTAFAAVKAIYSGHIYFGKGSSRSMIYAAQNPTGFWFLVIFYALIAAFLLYLAFRIRSK
jgi:hypothetical protein